jgi:hypothetical protein
MPLASFCQLSAMPSFHSFPKFEYKAKSGPELSPNFDSVSGCGGGCDG